MEPTCMSENKKKIIFIVNPISGTQSKELVLSLLDEKIDKEMYTWEVVYTERAGHAIEIAADAADKNTDIVVAVGTHQYSIGNYPLRLWKRISTASSNFNGSA